MPLPTGIAMRHCDVSESITQMESIHIRSLHHWHKPIDATADHESGV
jgi:hypothetical protein